MPAIDLIASELADRGWSCGDLSFVNRSRLVWQVYAHRGDQRIVARAPTQTEAWAAAAEQVRGVERM